jgi:predicted nucleotidyltransferase
MATQMWSYRVPVEHRVILKEVADAMKRDPSVGRTILEALRSGLDPQSIGAFKNEEAALGFIHDRLVLCLKPESIWLFGSRARRDHRRDSDFDILVVLPDALGDGARDYRRAVEPLLASGLPVDVVPCSLSEFEAAKDELGTLAFEAAHGGRLLYQRRRRTKEAA